MLLPSKNRTASCVLRTAQSKDAVRRTLYAVQKEAGFTLMEVLVAIMILATGLVLVIEGMARTQQAMRISENLVISSAIAEEKLIDSELEVRNVKKLGLSHERGEVRLTGKVFTWNREIVPYDDPSLIDQTKINRVETVVRWQEGPARANEFKLVSLIRNHEKKEEILSAGVQV